MNTEMIYQLAITGIILLFHILYMRLFFKYRLLMRSYNLKKRGIAILEKGIEALKRENADLQKELERVGNKNENPKEHTKINPNY